MIRDKAAPKTGGVTNQCPPNHRITFRAHHFKSAPYAKMLSKAKSAVADETNPIYRTAIRPRPKNTKRTQFTPTPVWPTIQIYETNPIPAPPPNLPRTGTACRAPTMRNEPNVGPAPPLFTIHRSLFTVLQNEPNPRATQLLARK